LGGYTEESDVDILVVADSFPSDPRKAYEIVKREVNARVEPTCFSSSTYLRKLESGSPFLMDILEDGKRGIRGPRIHGEDSLGKQGG
jgi:predicted nucleotidyltransferase